MDAEGGRWRVYLRWRHEGPWTADIIRCDKEWELQMGSKDNKSLFPAYDIETRSLDHYFRDDDYLALMERVLEVAKVYFPGLEFPNNY